MEEIKIALDMGIGLAVITGYVLYRLKKVKKKLRETILRRV